MKEIIKIMKKTVLSVFAIIAIVVSVNAQHFSLGIKGGGIGTKIDGQGFDQGYKLSYQGGVFAEFDLLHKIGIQPELLFSQTSSTYTTGLSGFPAVTQDIQLSYLSIPILLRYNFAKHFTLNVGPQYGILIDKNASGSDNVQSAFKNGNFSMVGGLQLHVSSLRVYTRYVVGLSNVNDVSSSEKWKTRQLEVGIGLDVL